MKNFIVALFTLVVLDPYRGLNYEEINVYDLSEKLKYSIKVYEACKNRCPDEYISDGYSEPEPERWEPSEPSYYIPTWNTPFLNQSSQLLWELQQVLNNQ